MDIVTCRKAVKEIADAIFGEEAEFYEYCSALERNPQNLAERLKARQD